MAKTDEPIITTDRKGEMLHAAVTELARHPQGMRPRDLLDAVGPPLELNEWELSKTKTGGVRWEGIVRLFSVDLVKCGWLERQEGGIWVITEDGRQALKLSPPEFIRQAMKLYRLWKRANATTSSDLGAQATGDESLAELVSLWSQSKFASWGDEDALARQRLAEFREVLARDAVDKVPMDELRKVWSPRGGNYGGTGPMSILNTTIRDADEWELQRIRDAVTELMYGDDPVERRLERVLEGDLQTRGLGDAVAMKLLTIAHPERFLPVYPYTGSKSKRALLELLPLGVDLDALDAMPRAVRQLEANDRLTSALEPLIDGDLWDVNRFCWWMLAQYEDLTAIDEPTEDAAPADDEEAASVGAARAKSVSFEELERITLLDRNVLGEIVDVLSGDQPHVILAGPPGTSKTFVADHVAQHLTAGAADRVTTVQLHPSYGYEEFVEGLRPSSRDGQLVFEPEAGPLLRVADAARRDPDGMQVLIVDEMNRANLPRVFGELLFLLEYRDRSLDLRFHPRFSLPGNVALIGTMNTADRSIRSIDAAIRRRFEIFECMPDAALLERWYASGRGTNHIPDLREGFERLNDRLAELLDRHHTVGHSFLMRQDLTPSALVRIWRRRIGPLVEEYLFDRPDHARELTLEWCWPSLTTYAVAAE